MARAVDAVGGPNNLLGNLLCAITGLLDNPAAGALNAINQLLDRIVGILDGLGLGDSLVPVDPIL